MLARGLNKKESFEPENDDDLLKDSSTLVSVLLLRGNLEAIVGSCGRRLFGVDDVTGFKPFEWKDVDRFMDEFITSVLP